jgi:lactate dehydrogenase-like 2-hydroxyacid dehydrogenase
MIVLTTNRFARVVIPNPDAGSQFRERANHAECSAWNVRDAAGGVRCRRIRHGVAMTMTVLQVGGVPPSIVEALTAKYAVLVLPIDAEREDFLAAHANSVRAIVDAGQVPIDADLMGALHNLGAIIHFGAGYDTVDIDTARQLGIGVSNTPDVLADTVADTAVGLMLITMRRFGAAERYVGSATTRTRAAMAELVLRNLDEYLTNNTLSTPVVAPNKVVAT